MVSNKMFFSMPESPIPFITSLNNTFKVKNIDEH